MKSHINKWISNLRLWLNDPADIYVIHKMAFALYLPILSIALFGKLERRRFDGESSVDTLLLLAPEITFYCLLIFCHIFIFRFTKSIRSKMISIPLYTFLGLLWFNFFIVEILGNVYGITTSNSDFDYSLIAHSLRHLDGLMAVFMSVLDPAIAISSIFLLAVYPLYLFFLIRAYRKSSFDRSSGDKQAALLLIFICIASGLYLTIIGAGRMQDVPLPLSISAIDRTISTKVQNMREVSAPPIRLSYGNNAQLKKTSPQSLLPNLVVIVLESTRQSSTTGSELGEQVAPFINNLKNKSLYFDRAYAVVPHTSKSIESIYCSVEPRPGLALVSANPIVGIPSKCMAGFLKELDYNSIFISTAPSVFENRDIFLKNANFDEYILGDMMDSTGYETVNYFGYEDKVMLPYVRNWLTTKDDKPFFMSLLTITPHHDYLVPAGFAVKHYSDDDTLNNYLNTLAYQDEYLKELMAIFEETGDADNTLFVIVGDHGEAFGEHNILMHDTVLYDEGIRVPLLFFGAGIDTPETITEPVSLLDIMPTAFARMRLEIESGGIEVIGGVDAYKRTSNDPVFSYCYREQFCSSIVKGDWKLIYHHGYETNELYNLKIDPLEKDNKVESENDRSLKMEKEITNWLASVRSYNQSYFRSKIEQ